MQSSAFVPVVLKSAPTGMLPQGDDTFLGGKKLLFPSPAAGRGSRVFLATHVIVHVISLVLTFVSMLLSVNDIAGDAIDGACILSLVSLIVGIVLVLGVSAMSTRPFENHGIVLALVLWGFLLALVTQGVAVALAYGANTPEHHTIAWSVLALMSQSAGASMLFAGITTGLAASARIES